MDLLDFGAHAPYVWTVYGVALVIFGANVIVPLLRHRRLLRELMDRQEGRQSQ